MTKLRVGAAAGIPTQNRHVSAGHQPQRDLLAKLGIPTPSRSSASSPLNSRDFTTQRNALQVARPHWSDLCTRR
jgi:hypothetical protein